MEDFVTFEQAIKLKELGFNWKCNWFYHEGCHCGPMRESYNFNDKAFKKDISAPTLAQAQKWLFEKRGVWVEINLLDFPNNFGYELKYDYYPVEKHCCQGYNSPKDSLSEGVNKAIEILKEENK